MPTPIRFGGVPIGVAIPPIDAPNAVMSIMVVEKRLNCGCVAIGCVDRWLTMESPIGNIMAAVAVLLIHIDRTTDDAAKDQQEATRAAADQPRRQGREGDAPVQAVDVHRFREDETADEEEDDRIGKRRERLRRRRDPQHDGQQRPEQRRDGERQRFGDPQHHDEDDDGREAVGLRRQRRDRQGEHQQEQERRRRTGRRSSAAG